MNHNISRRNSMDNAQYIIYTLDGKKLLNTARVVNDANSTSKFKLSFHLDFTVNELGFFKDAQALKSTSEYSENALLFQMKEVIRNTLGIDETNEMGRQKIADEISKSILYVDFSGTFAGKFSSCDKNIYELGRKELQKADKSLKLKCLLDGVMVSQFNTMMKLDIMFHLISPIQCLKNAKYLSLMKRFVI